MKTSVLAHKSIIDQAPPKTQSKLAINLAQITIEWYCSHCQNT